MCWCCDIQSVNIRLFASANSNELVFAQNQACFLLVFSLHCFPLLFWWWGLRNSKCFGSSALGFFMVLSPAWLPGKYASKFIVFLDAHCSALKFVYLKCLITNVADYLIGSLREWSPPCLWFSCLCMFG